MVLLNLVVNARDAMPDGGTICIEGQLRSSDHSAGQPAKDFVALIVRDTGCGMSPEVVARATEPFFTTKGTGKGTGLGLSMAQGLAEQSGGRLVLESCPGKGTTVELWLPIGVAAPMEEPARASTEEPVATGMAALSILVVDDDPLVLANTAALLEDQGHRVTAVADGQSALAVLRKTGVFDILVTDQMMPGLTGTQLADIVTVERPELPILLVSGYAELPEGSRGLRVLAKPFTQQSLISAIAETLGRTSSGVVVPLHTRR
jgi:CheY-like chemotaxis protein